MTQLIRSIITDISEGEIKRFSGQGRSGERFLNREYFQHYGFTSRPHAGAEGIALIRGNVVYLIASDDRRYRISLEKGEVALHDDQGSVVHLKRGGTILISSGGTVQVEAAQQVTIEAAQQVTIDSEAVSVTAQSATITAPEATLNGDLQVNGNIFATGSVTNAAGGVLHNH